MLASVYSCNLFLEQLKSFSQMTDSHPLLCHSRPLTSLYILARGFGSNALVTDWVSFVAFDLDGVSTLHISIGMLTKARSFHGAKDKRYTYFLAFTPKTLRVKISAARLVYS